jgi:energy-coupling factor transporter ATP-binding protein EcfA2
MSRGDFHCSLDRRSGLGELSCGPGAQAADAFLRTLLSSLLNESGGALVHACGLAVDGKAHIFIGRSGAGKSTLARLASGAGVEVISDEIVPLRRERGRFFVYGSPFWGEMRPAGRPLKIPLAGICALRKSRVNSLRPGPSAGFMPLFLRCCLNFSKEPAAASGLLDTAAAIRSLYKGEFHFSKKNASFLKLLK